MISYKHKFIFIHIPKSGGTSIENVLFQDVEKTINPSNADEVQESRKNLFGRDRKMSRWLQHLTYTEIVKCEYVNQKTIKNFFKFSFVRNPWSRKLSEYEWNVRINKDTNKFDMSFTDFVKSTYSPYKAYVHSDPMYNFIVDESGNNKMDFIGKLENLQEDFNFVCDKIGIPKQQLPHANKTKHKHYTEYYNDETRQIVAEKYAKDIEYFGYKFGE